MEKPSADFLIEVSWECANKVGGIHTVISSKAHLINEIYKGEYLCLGPYFKDKARQEFIEKPTPPQYAGVFKALEEQGIKAFFGEWEVAGRPKIILIDFQNLWHNINDYKKQLWDLYKVDSLHSGNDFDEIVVWGYAAYVFLKELLTKSLINKKVVINFHEWLTSPALLFLKRSGLKFASVFTTHATILGRTLAGNDFDLYDKLEKINVQELIYRYAVEAKHLTEAGAAQTADIFTTVSEITALEAEKFLNRFADVLTYNGLEISRFPSFEELATRHGQERTHLREFCMYYFFPYYSFDLNQSLFYFIIGRYEFHNKGIDIFIRALGELNRKLKKENSSKTIISFIFIPNQNGGVVPELAEAKEIYESIKTIFHEELDDLEGRLMEFLISDKEMTREQIFDPEFTEELSSRFIQFKNKGNPPLSTHKIGQNDLILQSLRNEGLTNSSEDKIKVVLYPIYVSPSDGLLNMTYEEVLMAEHLGVFPSYYEPWGYTPLETAASGVASITSDLAGFGRFIQKAGQENKVISDKYPGVYILPRFNKGDDEVVKDLTKILYDYSLLDRAGRVENKLQARRLANLADWQILVENYIKAHNLAVKKIY